MALPALRTDERVGLGVAVALHLALVAVLVWQPGRDEVLPMPERMTVTLATDVSLAATAPDPVPESLATIAPTLSAEPQPMQTIDRVQAEPLSLSQQVAITPPQKEAALLASEQEKLLPQRRRPERPAVRASPAPKIAPMPTAQAILAPKAAAVPAAKTSSAPKVAALPAAQASSAPKAATVSKTKPAGGSRIGADFLPGAGASTNTNETRVPASEIGASAKASLAQAIARQLRPHWTAPQGVDAEKLVTVLAFDLNADGSLAGRPRVVSQTGETPSNAPQKDLHAERAIRAVQLAAPFDLPPEYYEAWKRVSAFRFDRNLN